MEITNELLSYEVPQVEVIEVEVEKGFAISSLENPERGDSADW